MSHRAGREESLDPVAFALPLIAVVVRLVEVFHGVRRSDKGLLEVPSCRLPSAGERRRRRDRRNPKASAAHRRRYARRRNHRKRRRIEWSSPSQLARIESVGEVGRQRVGIGRGEANGDTLSCVRKRRKFRQSEDVFDELRNRAVIREILNHRAGLRKRRDQQCRQTDAVST
jgi:hypothetical protein